MTAEEFATSVDSDPPTVRRFLRHHLDESLHPGSTGRWDVPDDDYLRSAFRAWAATTPLEDDADPDAH